MRKALCSKEFDFVVMSTTFIKMTRKDQIKILDDKIKTN